MILKPISWKRRAIGVTVGLSESITVTSTTPSSGRPFDAASCAFAKADPYVQNGLVKSWKVREWTTVVGADAQVKLPDVIS